MKRENPQVHPPIDPWNPVVRQKSAQSNLRVYLPGDLNIFDTFDTLAFLSGNLWSEKIRFDCVRFKNFGPSSDLKRAESGFEKSGSTDSVDTVWIGLGTVGAESSGDTWTLNRNWWLDGKKEEEDFCGLIREFWGELISGGLISGGLISGEVISADPDEPMNEAGEMNIDDELLMRMKKTTRFVIRCLWVIFSLH